MFEEFLSLILSLGFETLSFFPPTTITTTTTTATTITITFTITFTFTIIITTARNVRWKEKQCIKAGKCKVHCRQTHATLLDEVDALPRVIDLLF